LAYALAAFTLVSILSALLCDDPPAALKNLRNYALFVTVFMMASLASDQAVLRRIRFVLLAAGAGSAAYGVAIYLLGMGRGSLGRTPGPFSNSMTFGGIMMLLLSLFAAMSIGRSIPRRLRIPSVAAAALCSAALLLTQTRSSWLAMVVSSVMIVAVLRRRWIPVLLAVFLACTFLMPRRYTERVRTIWDPNFRTNVQRINMIRGGLSIYWENPVFGAGPLDLGEIYRDHMPPGAVHVHGHMHNIFLQVAVTLGSVGLAAFLWLLASMLRIIVRACRAGLPPPEYAFSAGSLGAAAGFLVNGLFDWNFGDAEVLTMLLIIIGMNAAALGAAGSAREAPARDPRPDGRTVPLDRSGRRCVY
jgi:O-antigen ligase